MKINIKTEYKSELEKKIPSSIGFSEIKFNWLKGALIGTCLGVLAIGGLNYKLHNGPQKHEYATYTECFAKPTGVASYAEYRKFEFYEEDAEKKLKKKYANVVVKGTVLLGSELYLDEDNDGKVDTINTDGKFIYKLFKRSEDYDMNKQKFDEADKFFAKYLKELKEKNNTLKLQKLKIDK
ncbi:MAG: hypothetical protein Q8O03_07515 [Nanoarchaeota archaeon]|nr:hypothetical protein [Nanoarchaeota archaeon]